MAVRVYRWRKPELTVTLTAGGTLAASTTYYIAGYFSKNWIYNDSESPFSDVVSFTTDTVNKSISVAWKVTVPIQGFEDAGGGKIRVLATNHCLDSNNTLIIESGVYAGTYTVNSWVDYNRFLIVGTYSTTYATTFRVETMHNSLNCIMFYMHTVAPFSGDPTLGTWQGTASKMNAYPWSATITTTPVAITAPFSTAHYGIHPQIGLTSLLVPSWCKVMVKGKPWIEASGTATVAELKQACIDADIIDIAYVSNDTFVLWCILRSTGTLPFTDMIINVNLGIMSGYASNSYPCITYTRCSCSFALHGYGSYFSATAYNSSFIFKYFANGNAPYAYPIGSDNSFLSVIGINAEGMSTNFTVSGMVVNTNSGQWAIECSGTRTKLYINCRINTGTLRLYYINIAPLSTWRMLDGFYINSNTTYDISLQYNNSQSLLEIRNIDTNRANNEKIVYNAYSQLNPTSIYFYRGNIITILDTLGNPIVGVTVKLKNAIGTEYTYTTNSSGVITFEILEQISVPPATAIITLFTNTVYNVWTQTVSKTGYETYISISSVPKDIDTKVTLKPITLNRFTAEGKPLRALSPEMGSSSNLLEL